MASPNEHSGVTLWRDRSYVGYGFNVVYTVCWAVGPNRDFVFPHLTVQDPDWRMRDLWGSLPDERDLYVHDQEG